MISRVTYANLVKKYGRGTVVPNDPKNPIRLTAKLHLENLDRRSTIVGGTVVARQTAGADIQPAASGLMKIRFVLTAMGANENKQVFVEDECQHPNVYQSVLGEAINEDHVPTFHAIVGEITASEFVQATNQLPALIRCSGVIFADDYPHIANKIRRGAGKWAAVSMEALGNPVEQIGSYLIVHDPTFIGCGLVRMPGCAYSKIEEVDDAPASGATLSASACASILSAGLAEFNSRML